MLCDEIRFGLDDPGVVAFDAVACRFEEDLSEGRVLGGVVVPAAVLRVDEDRLLGAADESLERLLGVLSARTLFLLDSRRKS